MKPHIKTEFQSVNGKEVREFMAQPDVHLIDVRPVDAYNGWRLMQESRGGHIPGAKSLPARWTQYIDWIEMVIHKKIYANQVLIIYGYQSQEILQVAGALKKAGYDQVMVYHDFLNEWVNQPEWELKQLTRFRNLVPASWVNSLISGEKPEEHPDDHYLIVHAHYRNRNAYLSGHIPGAIDMDTLAVEEPEKWNLRSPEELKKVFEEHGIGPETTVILYGKFMFPDNNDEFPGSAAGDIGAMRIAHIMMYAGIKDVRIINGGFDAWQQAGYAISQEDVAKVPLQEFTLKIPQKPELAVDIEEAKAILASELAELVCVRSFREYIGEVSGYNYIKPKGRIPGAVFADCGSDAYHMENYRNNDHTTREFPEIERIWIEAGLDPAKRLAFYCGTGWRGSEAWFNAWLMGWPDVAVFDGGWYEWSMDPANPFETGRPVSEQAL